MKKKGLGRGLDALLPEANYEGTLREISVHDIDLNPHQPRKDFDPDALQQLAESILEVGLLQPILVSRHGGRYRIIAGERRYRAARLAGLSTIPCIEKSMDDQENRLAALVENLQRADLNPMEEAHAISALMQAGGLTQEEAARQLGKSRPAVANVLRLLKLPREVQDMLVEGTLTEGHARVLAGLKSASRQVALALRTVHEGLSVRALEALCKQENAPRPPRYAAPLPPELRDLEERLHRATGVRTMIHGDLKKGRITLNYKTAEELDTLYRALEGIL